MPEGLDEPQQAAWTRDAAFLAQLQEPSAAADVALPAALAHVNMRPYQREGLAWLAFLRRSGLHGVLADDMGLGKTLQTTAVIAGACAPLECISILTSSFQGLLIAHVQ